MINTVIKKDGREELFSPEKIKRGLFKSVQAAGGNDKERSDKIANIIIQQLNEKFPNQEQIKSTDILDEVELTLLKGGYDKVSRAFILHRYRNSMMRNNEQVDQDNLLMKNYLDKNDWTIKENANTNYSLSAMNFNISQKITQNYWLTEIYPDYIAKEHIDASIHIHDLGIFGAYCCGWDLQDLLNVGFTGAPGCIKSNPPKHFRSALGIMVNFLFSTQNEIAGAVAFSNVDTLLAPFIRYDELDRKQIKQALQEFVFNLNVPTRSAMQCMSEDTEILTPTGWKSYNELNIGDTILNFNLKNQKIETQKIRKVFKKEYSGEMYNLKNRIQDQLISPNHRVVRQLFNTNEYILDPIENVYKLKSPVIIPISGININKDIKYSDDIIKLIAWIITEGSSRSAKGQNPNDRRITITQSKKVNYKKYVEIKNILNSLNIKFSEQSVGARLGQSVINFSITQEDSLKLHELFGDEYNIKYIPKKLLNMSQRQAKLFIETFIKGDGHEKCKITSTEKNIIDSLQHICTLAGYGSTVLMRPPTKIGTKKIYVLRIIFHQKTYITKIKKIQYNGIIWCPNTKNETVIARRNNKVFITGNTPFSNLTFDLTCPKNMKGLPVIIGGEMKNENYGDFQEEMNLINDVFCEVLLEGDGNGRVFTFPIPTYNITKDFDWNDKNLNNLWTLTAKFGSPYFTNYINSSMSVDDSRSFCCRLKSDITKVKYRGNGLFGAYPLVGSLGVCTINLPRIGIKTKTKEDFLKELERLANICHKSLEIKRTIIEKYTEQGLYPFCKFYLRSIKEKTGEYWANHFSTIGILGMEEALLNMKMGGMETKEGIDFTKEVLEFLNKKASDFEKETGRYTNIEAVPGEGTTRKFAHADKKQFPTCIVANEKDYTEKGVAPYYTNSTNIPVGKNIDLFTQFELQNDIQPMYTGGVVFHVYAGEKAPSPEAVKSLIKRSCENYKIPYFSFTPSFSICPIHHYIPGEHKYCPKCLEEGDNISL